MPPPRKPAGKRINRITKDVGAVSRPGVAPAMPRGLCRPAADAWHAFWSDAVSGVTRPPDTVVVLRYVKSLDRWHRLLAEADKSPIVPGSTGQPSPNPLYRLVFQIEASIREDEKQLGVGPANRAKLGLSVTEAAHTLAELNAQAGDDDEDDFRLTLMTTTTRRRRERDGQVHAKNEPEESGN